MIVNWILFIGLSLVSIVSALGMLLSRSAVYSALNLIINLVTIAVFYLILGAPFISLAQIAIYAGAIMVLFLFVIMLLGAEHLGAEPVLPWQLPLAIVLGAVLMIEVVFLSVTRLGKLSSPGIFPKDFGSPQAVGAALFSSYLLPFEVISIILLVAIIGAIVLTKVRRVGHGM